MKTPRTFKTLFIDDYAIESLDGVSRNLNQPIKHAGNPVLPIVPKDQSSWDAGMLPRLSSIIFDDDEKLFKMWYGLQNSPWEQGGVHEAVDLAYTTSQDGIVWHKGPLNIFSYREATKNNLLRIEFAGECGVFKDPHETDPAKLYKMLWLGPEIRVCASYSPDGLEWTPYNEGQAVILQGRDAHVVPYWDEQLGKYVAIVRERTGKIEDIRKQLVSDPQEREAYIRIWGDQPEGHTTRRVGQAVSDDFEHWSPVRVIVEADSDDPINRDHFYSMEVMLYEGLRVGFMPVYSYDRQYCRGAVQLTCSRDGMNWHRAGNREVFLPLSDQPGDFDWGRIQPGQGPLVVGDEIWIYYTGIAVDHKGLSPAGTDTTGIGLAKLRLDGFVSVDAGAEEGTLTTKPFTPDGGQTLVINADASKQGGYILVEILDADKTPIPQLSRDNCDVLDRDEIRHTVTWGGSSDLNTPKGRNVRLRFYLKEAKLFSYKFE